MSYGYSARLIVLNKEANQNSLGVKLGALCILHNVPVTSVATELKVSRQTVYNWFCGVHPPKESLEAQIEAYIEDKLAPQ
jgi:transposase-like protein